MFFVTIIFIWFFSGIHSAFHTARLTIMYIDSKKIKQLFITKNIKSTRGFMKLTALAVITIFTPLSQMFFDTISFDYHCYYDYQYYLYYYYYYYYCYHFYSVKELGFLDHTYKFYKETIYTNHKIHIYTIDVQRRISDYH